MLRALTQSIFDLFLPKECPACRTGHELDDIFCDDCQEQFDRLTSAARCQKCAMPATIPGAPCAHCENVGLRPYKKIASLGVLKEPLKSLIHRIKYENRWSLAENLADRIGSRADVQALFANADVIMPVPLHPRRHRQRGYNQAEVIARRVGNIRKVFDSSGSETDMRIVFPTVRVRATETQTHLHSRAQRMENLKDAFVLVDPDAIRAKNVLVVDDVLTTGATLVSLARTLRPAKPASLSAIVLAVADPKGRAFELI